MMDYMAEPLSDIDRMPRGGPDASCVDRLLQTDRLEYLDRDSDGDAAMQARKRRVIRALEWAGQKFGHTERFAKIALDEVADVPDPSILELGAGHGGLSRTLLDWHPTARLTVTDIEAESVAAMARGELGAHPRSGQAVFTEGTRVADTLLIIDLPRPPTRASNWTCAAG